MKKKHLRIVLSPFIFLWGVFILAAGSIFPIPLIVMFSFFGVIATPFIWVLRQSGSDISYIGVFTPFSSNEDSFLNAMAGSVLGLTIYFWLPFAAVYLYVKSGEIILINE